MLWWRQAFDALFNGAPDPVVLPPRAYGSAWDTEERRDARAAAAMSLLDDDVVGFFLLTFHSSHHIAVSHVVDNDWWTPIADAVTKVRKDV